MADADELVRGFVLREFREECWGKLTREAHLATCPETQVLDCDARDGSYGCDTGCDYYRLEAQIGCPHGESVEYDYGSFGEISSLIWQLERE